MNVETFCLGSLDTNAYLVWDQGTACWVFDCPGQPAALVAAIHRAGLRPLGVYLTHAHVDHMAGLNAFREAFPGVAVFQHPLEVTWLADPQANLSAWMGEPVTADPAEGLVHDGEVLELGRWRVRVLHLPGHSPGSVGYWFEGEGQVFSGDVLFRSGVGRWDFPGCSRDDLRASLDRLCSLGDEVRVWPGHGGSTTLGRERASNPYLRSAEAWE